MDWNSPTTKKHIAEAKAQGCELIGPGRNTNYRLYRLSCGHEREVGTTAMRRGGFQCQTCINNKLKAEAKARGCDLVGAGRNATFRTYRLECGHEQEIQLGAMRVGRFRCQTCLDDRLKEEAQAQRCELMGAGRSKDNRTYLLDCGHQQVILIQKMRFGIFRCQTCLDDRLKEEAEAQRCELMGSGRNKDCRTYRLDCGHEQEVQLFEMRRGTFRCQTCLDNKLREEAEEQGCVLLGSGSHTRRRTYRFPCGHEQEIETSNMRMGTFRCQSCLDNNLKKEAELRGCELLGAGKDCYYRTYRLECGHEQEITLGNMRLGNFCCQTCEEYHYTQPSNAYLLHIKVGADEWLKLGYAKDVDFRTTRYGLPSEAEASVLATRPFDTGKEAREFETSLHQKHKRKRLRAKDMLIFHTGSGSTECYPLTMVEKLMSEMKADSYGKSN